MRLLVEYTSHSRGPAVQQTYTTALDIVDDVAEYIGKRNTLVYEEGHGTTLITEGAQFAIDE